jgi:hypothetical protein
MVGTITGWDILAHPITTIRCFGWGVFFRAVAPWNRESFLSLLRRTSSFGAESSSAFAILQRCIGLELRAQRIYTALAKAFSGTGLVEVLFAGLAQQEQYHADLLGVCLAAARRGGWSVNAFNPWQEYLARLEQQMSAAAAAVYEIDSMDAALQMVIRVESSEINEVFHAAVAATNSAFVKKLKPFKQAMEAHMSYIVERLPELSPNLLPACRELRARFPRVHN